MPHRAKPLTLAHALGAVALLAAHSGSAVSIQFDYRYDTGFFTDPAAGAERRQVMDYAASFFGGFTDSLAPIESSGSNTWTMHLNRPDTGLSDSILNEPVAADTVVVFAGGTSLAVDALALAAPGGYTPSGSAAFVDTVTTRGQAGVSTGDDFGPWGGSIAFDVGRSWYFGLDTTELAASGQYDFLSVAVHELAHVLGFGTAPSWSSKVANGYFTGANAVTTYGSLVPLAADEAHWMSGVFSDHLGLPQEAALDPELAPGQRKLLTTLDYAALADVGWEIAAMPVPVPAGLWLLISAIGALALVRRPRETEPAVERNAYCGDSGFR